MWRSPDELREPEEGERDTIYVALANGEVKLADASAYVERCSEYHGTTGVYLGTSIQDAWSGWIGWEGDMFERDDSGWHCYRYPNADDTKVRVAVIGWQSAIKEQPAAPAIASVAAKNVGGMAMSTGSLRRLLSTKRNVEDARMIVDMLVHRLREGGPDAPREEIRQRLMVAAEKLNIVAPRSITRESE